MDMVQVLGSRPLAVHGSIAFLERYGQYTRDEGFVMFTQRCIDL